MSNTSDSTNPVPPGQPKVVGKGLAGLDLDVSKMSPKTREVYKEYLAIADDDSPGDNEGRLKDAEHALRNAHEADRINQAADKGDEKSPDKPGGMTNTGPASDDEEKKFGW